MAEPVVQRTRYAPGERHERHAHGYANISVVLAGSLVERVGRTEVIAGPLSVVVKPAGTEHADTFGPCGARLLRLSVGPEWMSRQEDGVRAVDRWGWLTSPPAVRWLLRLASAGPRAGHTTEDGLAECLGGIEAPAAPDPPGEIPVWLHRVHERIRDERGRRLRVADLARDAGVHPVYLTRRFRRAFGCSVVGCIQAERVRLAADRLAATDEPLSSLAYSAGFADQAHLSRAFARASGLTPATYRYLAQGGAEVEKVQEQSAAPA